MGSVETSQSREGQGRRGLRRGGQGSLAGLLRPHWRRILLSIVLMILLTAVNLVVPLLIALVFNRVFPEANWTLLFGALAGILALYLCRNVLYFFSKTAALQVGENVAFELRRGLFESLQQRGLSFYRKNQSGQLSSRVMNDSSVVQQFIQDDFPKLAQAGLLFVGIIATIFAINWQLALASTIVLPLHFFAFIYFRGPIKREGRNAQQYMAAATGNLIEKFLGVEVVKGSGAEERENNAFAQSIELSRQSQLRGKRYHVMQKVVADVLIGLGVTCLFGFGAYQVIGREGPERLLPGDFIAFFWYVRMLYPAVLDLIAGLAKFTRATTGVERAMEVLQSAESERVAAGARPELVGAVRYEKVSFGYEDKHPILNEINFEARPGQVCAIVGSSGAGKSTLVSLLPRFDDPSEGRVLVDGYDVRDIDLRHLRRSIGIAFQECFLFNASILENIRYARAEASFEEIESIADRIGASEFIQRLPDGYHTLVGDGAMNLSRGQKQLISLMRAMLKNPTMLILDEATASIDIALESKILPAILEFMRERTTLMITHNPALLKHADTILRLDHGRIDEVKTDLPSGVDDDSQIARWLKRAICWPLFALLAVALPPPTAKAAAESPDDLFSEKIRLSYTDSARCLSMLQVFGYSVGKPGQPADRQKLPWIIAVPASGNHKTVAAVGADFPETVTDPLHELMVFFDPERPEQFSSVLEKVRAQIDLPARQIMIEAMVLEIAETSLNRLGVQWSRPGGRATALTLGRIVPDAGSLVNTASADVTEIFKTFDAKVRALLDTGEAEVMSRPSVLTLDNRMAYINVAEQIPIAETKFLGNGNVSTVNFREKTVGIQLSVRPRVSDNAKEISLQVSAQVSSRVPDEDVVVRDSRGNVVATSPVISVREVKTYARIANNTPFIIGGLVARDDLSQQEKVPFLGRLPLLGKVFGNESLMKSKREVIIVLTPFVLPEDNIAGRYVPDEKIIGRNMPKDEDAFDSFGNELFRDAYRIRDEDVFDLAFVTENQELRRMQSAADEAIAADYRLASTYPYMNFHDGRIPGEQILVYRQMYEVIKRIGLHRRLDPEKFIFFEEDESSASGFGVTFFQNYLQNLAESTWQADQAEGRVSSRQPDDPWQAMGPRALALIYSLRRTVDDADEILMEPVPEARLLDCPDGETYDRLLWELNQPGPDGLERKSILLRGEKDVTRLQRAILLRQTVALNSNERSVTLDNFSVGRLLLLPARGNAKIDLIDADVAKYFFYSEQYYQALKQQLDRDISALKTALRKN